ncbi:monovalent cation/H+ antiporter subunit A [Glutamicibacter uratoxydans]|uniref:Monovalent cation/H+ antiporter subunit A n=1 Tax=Glutamicibacter uratoxydans TaxID=43667 RepID=A0A4Y4DNK7_GLUUR|nr:Na+/H+ antiporter subunit A [Glutamicibacter uratoxydans]GED05245.1 monovalent cation/H+ antiporter subunit A [Glutamicibacter uratoxydans]
MLTILSALFATAALCPILFRAFKRNAFYIVAVVPAVGFIWLLFQLPTVLSSDQTLASGAPNAPPSLQIDWISGLNIGLNFRMDTLSATILLLILGVGALVLFYCARYFKNDDPQIGSFAAKMVAFAGAMTGLVTADDIIIMFIFWEITSVLSYLLIGFSQALITARRSAMNALIVTTLGGLVMLAGILMLGAASGSYQLSEILASAEQLKAMGTYTDVAIALVIVGALSKSALVPFHFWLPGAMAAPTPVSAYLHAAAMVKAGVYLIARLAPGFADTAFWVPMTVGIGITTMLIGGFRALKQYDLKLILAFGTVSQLGFIIAVFGFGTPEASFAALAMTLAHGLFKATLFLSVGIIDHNTGTRDIRKLTGLRRAMPILATTTGIAAASMAGIPLTLGFVAKEGVYESALHLDSWWGTAALAGIVLGAGLTLAYSLRFFFGAFGVKKYKVEPRSCKPPTLIFLAPLLVLSALTLLLGIYPHPVELLAKHWSAAQGGPAGMHLAAFAGFNAALGLSAASITLGVVFYLIRRATDTGAPLRRMVISAEELYRMSVNALDIAAIWITGRTQRGSLSFYLGVILAVVLVVPLGIALSVQTPWPSNWVLADHPAQIVIGVIIIAGAVISIIAPKRFMAVLMVSVTGYGMVAIFALQGAPDLALTQLLVETIVLVSFVLALRALPKRLWVGLTTIKWGRALLAIALAVMVIYIAIAMLAARGQASISLQWPDLAYYEGYGKNIVNVALVDLRVWDTFGEITVLAAAATGVASLIFAGRGFGARVRATDVAPGSIDSGSEAMGTKEEKEVELRMARRFAASSNQDWLMAGNTLVAERRSIIFEVVTRLMFHSVLILSVYTLLAGHNTPGGGFAGGLIAGLALTIRYLAGGRIELSESMRIAPGMLIGGGIALAGVAGIVPLFVGDEIFTMYAWEFWLPVFGEHKFVTSTIFDIGVYLVVLGLVQDVLRSLGSEIDLLSEGRSPIEQHDPIHASTTGVGR